MNTIVGSTKQEVDNKTKFVQLLKNTQIPDDELMDNLGVFLTRQNLSRINFIQTIYKKIIPVHGVIMEFGVRWGQDMSLFSNLRGIHEPYNYNRQIIGFDTFEGFTSVSSEDGYGVQAGDYAVLHGWDNTLNEILEFHNNNSPISHISKHTLVKGDASKTLPDYLKANPETIIALAYFDFDLYKPTKDCLEALLPHVTKGTVLAFDELNVSSFPGETLALKEVLGLSSYSIQRDPNSPLTSFLVLE